MVRSRFLVFAVIGSLLSAAAFALRSSVAHAVAVAAATAGRVWDVAFPATAAAEKVRVAPISTEAVSYGSGLARLRSFLERFAVRHDHRLAFTGPGLATA